jgi:hypothetical protein
MNETMNLIRYRPGHFFLETVEIHEHERPPMISLPEYRSTRGLNHGEEDWVHDVREHTVSQGAPER